MGRYNPDDYEMVEHRIKRFYNDHPEGKITTELISDPNNQTFAMFKAFVWVDAETLVATGHAQEQAGQSNPVNKTSHLENCETSAIGRALANHKYSGKKRPSQEEMAKTSTPTVEPAQPKKETVPSHTNNIQDKFQKCAANKEKFAPEIGQMMNKVLEHVNKGEEAEIDKIMEEYGIA